MKKACGGPCRERPRLGGGVANFILNLGSSTLIYIQQMISLKAPSGFPTGSSIPGFSGCRHLITGQPSLHTMKTTTSGSRISHTGLQQPQAPYPRNGYWKHRKPVSSPGTRPSGCGRGCGCRRIYIRHSLRMVSRKVRRRDASDARFAERGKCGRPTPRAK